MSEADAEIQKARSRRKVFSAACQAGFGIWSTAWLRDLKPQQREEIIRLMISAAESGYQFALEEPKETK
jgi:hypothetical protein